jgi:hypothetical protein
MALVDDLRETLFGWDVDERMPDCACGCGLQVKQVARQTRTGPGHRRGQPTPYRRGHTGRWTGPLLTVSALTVRGGWRIGSSTRCSA